LDTRPLNDRFGPCTMSDCASTVQIVHGGKNPIEIKDVHSEKPYPPNPPHPGGNSVYPRFGNPSRGSVHHPHTSPDGGCADRAPHDARPAQGMHCAPIVQIVQNSVSPVDKSIVSNTDQSPVIDFARQLRSRFGQGVRLTFHVELERTQGRQPYWWGCFDA
jgi:hypothetical protein